MADILPLAPLSLLLIEDSPSDAMLFEERLKYSSHPCRVTLAQTVKEAAKLMEEKRFDVALLDLYLPDAIGFSALLTLQNLAPTLPIIILTGHDDQLLAYKAVERGAQDFLIKDEADGKAILRAIRYAIQRKRFEHDLIEQANFDKLTGLANRTLFESRLEIALARAKRSGQGLGVFFLDLDRFKSINDTLGHASGDRLLQQVAQRIKTCVRRYDTVARFGGDEFAVLLEDIKQPRDCAAIAQKIISSMMMPFEFGAESREVAISIGIATCFEGESANVADLMQHADQAMYHAKSAPFSFYQFYAAPLQEQMHLRLEQEEELRHAMSADELVVYYQPKISLQSNNTVGVEALLRWTHPRKGQLLPHEFLSAAKEGGMLCAVDRWVLNSVCKDIEAWQKSGIEVPQVSVNISNGLLDTTDLLPLCTQLVRQHDIAPGQLALEISESALIDHLERRTDTLDALRKLGIAIHVDHFGGEVLPLKALKNAPLDALKIDCNSLGTLSEETPTRARMMDAMIALAQSLELTVIATGVENRWQQSYLKDKRCEQAQGFALARPMPASYLRGWLNGGAAELQSERAV